MRYRHSRLHSFLYCHLSGDHHDNHCEFQGQFASPSQQQIVRTRSKIVIRIRCDMSERNRSLNLPIRAHSKELNFCLLDPELRKSAQFYVFRALGLASRDFLALESVSHVSPEGSLFVVVPKSKTRVDSVKFALKQFRTEQPCYKYLFGSSY